MKYAMLYDLDGERLAITLEGDTSTVEDNRIAIGQRLKEEGWAMVMERFYGG